MNEVMPGWNGWSDVDPVIDGPEIVTAQGSSQWSDENARAAVVESRSRLKWLALAMSTLTTRSERIVRMYFGLDGYDPAMTMKEIAEEAECTQSAVSSTIDDVFRWRGRFRRIVLSVLSDYPNINARAELARLVEKSALMRIDEPRRIAERRGRAAVRAASIERAKIAEAMRLRFRVVVYGKTMAMAPRSETIAYRFRLDENRDWRWNPCAIHLSWWSVPSLSNPATTSSVVMAHAPDEISKLRFRRGATLAQ